MIMMLSVIIIINNNNFNTLTGPVLIAVVRVILPFLPFVACISSGCVVWRAEYLYRYSMQRSEDQSIISQPSLS